VKLKEKGFQLFGLIADKALKSYSKRTPDLPMEGLIKVACDENLLISTVV
jgi:hypothetical protein